MTQFIHLIVLWTKNILIFNGYLLNHARFCSYQIFDFSEIEYSIFNSFIELSLIRIKIYIFLK